MLQNLEQTEYLYILYVLYVEYCLKKKKISYYNRWSICRNFLKMLSFVWRDIRMQLYMKSSL